MLKSQLTPGIICNIIKRIKTVITNDVDKIVKIILC